MRKLIIVGQTIFRNHVSLCPVVTRYEFLHERRYSSDHYRLDAIKMSYKEYGDSLESSATPIVIMHGLFGSKMNWNYASKGIHATSQRKACFWRNGRFTLLSGLSSDNWKRSVVSKYPDRKVFRQKFGYYFQNTAYFVRMVKNKVYTVDARNHGDSPHTPEHSYILLAKDLEKFFQDRNIEKAVLLGHSMGGRAAMYFALTHPHLVDKLIVCDISPIGTSGGFQEISDTIQAVRDINLKELAAQKHIFQARTKAENTLMNKFNMDKRIASYLVSNLKEDGSGGYMWRVNLDAIHENYVPHITIFPLPKDANYAGPTLFVVGKQSDFVQPEQYDEIRTIFPDVSFLELDAGHWVHADKPQEFITGVCNFLESD